MKLLVRLVAMFISRAMVAIGGAACALILLVHLQLGERSPGIVTVARDWLLFWGPLIGTLTALWLVGTCARVILQARTRALGAGITLVQYFDLAPEQKSKLGNDSKSTT